MASRILDIAGIVVNRNTIPGDTSALDPSGIRMGTPWITQRGFKEAETSQLADIIADILLATKPHSRVGMAAKIRRAKVDFEVLEQGKLRVRELALAAGIDFEPANHGYPHFYYIDEKPAQKDWVVLNLSGDRVRFFLDLGPGQRCGSAPIRPIAGNAGQAARESVKCSSDRCVSISSIA